MHKYQHILNNFQKIAYNTIYEGDKLMRKNKIDTELVECIIKAKSELNAASKNFEQAEGELIHYYLYQIKAQKVKLDYLIKEVKKKGFSLDMINEVKLRIG